jgi:hypothetical protein
VKRFRQAAKYSWKKDEGHLSDLANRSKSHHFMCLHNYIAGNRETLILRSILDFWFILQMTSFRIFLVALEYAMVSGPSTRTSSVCTSLALAKSPLTGRNTTIDF